MLLRVAGVALTREVAEGLEQRAELEEVILASCERVGAIAEAPFELGSFEKLHKPQAKQLPLTLQSQVRVVHRFLWGYIYLYTERERKKSIFYFLLCFVFKR